MIVTLAGVPAVVAVRAVSSGAADIWLRVGEGVTEAPGESREQICSSSSTAVEEE